MDKEKKNNEWVRVSSKSNGRFCMLNKATGESQYLPLNKGDTKEKKQSTPLSFLASNCSKTPAQDRLKRLQHTLKLSQAKRSLQTKVRNLKEQENEIDGPPTSQTSKYVAKKTAKNVAASAKSEEDSSQEKSEGDSFNAMNDKNSILSTICSGIFTKIKHICKIPFKGSKKISDETLHSKTENTLCTINNPKFKQTSKTKSKHILSKALAHETIINQIKDGSKRSENEVLTYSQKITPKSQKTLVYPRGSANSRLELLKQSLLLQQKSSSTEGSSDTSTAIEVNNSTTSLHEKDNFSSNVSTDTVDKTKKDEIEAMDWQGIVNEESQSDATAFKPTLVVEKSKKFLLDKVHGNENQTIGDIIDTVNENLLRFSANKEKDTAKEKSVRGSFYYIVVDTNVLLRDLVFVEDLLKMKLCGTKGSMLYIPYAVLQELDKLKMCSGPKEGVKTQAVRAIKYLNSKLENNSLNVQAQSALEERHHSIDVSSADDSIINCCLQLKKYIPNFIFLSEDVNLRNKAICNNILVSTKSDLLAKRYDCGDNS